MSNGPYNLIQTEQKKNKMYKSFKLFCSCPEALARPRARKGADEHGDRAGHSNDTRLVRWQRGPKAPNPHDVLHLRPRARPRGPQWQHGGREARVGHEDESEEIDFTSTDLIFRITSNYWWSILFSWIKF